MEFDGLKINTPKGQKKEEPKIKEEHAADATDYVVEGASGGRDILKHIKRIHVSDKDNVIYGVYDNSKKPWSVKFNDFLIDRGSVSLKDKSYFFHMLAVMVDAGIPVVGAVKSLASRSDNPKFRRVLNTVAYTCEHGSKLADAMERFEDVFDDFEVGIVKSGEATGHLNTMLFQLSSELDKKHDLSLKLWGAAVYPIAVMAVLLLVTIGMLVWVFPTLLNMLTEGGIGSEQLPISTRILLTVQTGVTTYWWAILIVLFGIFGMFKMYTATDYGATKWDYAKLRIPIVGGLLRRLFVLRFVSMLGLLIDSGLPVIRSLKITGGALSNRLYRLKTQEVINVVKDGGKISDSLADSEYLFPPEVSQMIRVGEKSASLARISVKISDQYQREIDNSLKKISSVFEPVMILFVGLFVGLLALAVMAPIFNLSTLIQ